MEVMEPMPCSDGTLMYSLDRSTGTLHITPSNGREGTLSPHGCPLVEHVKNFGIRYIASDGAITVTGDCSDLFYQCGITDLGFLSEWRFEGITGMTRMFDECRDLADLDGLARAAWDTGNVTDMSLMFYRCTGLADLDGLARAGWDTSNVTNMSCMFNGCTRLTDLDGLARAGWDTSNVEDMGYMFSGCSGLMDLDALGKAQWDTGNVTNMSRMFSRCESLDDPTGIRGVLAVTGCDDSAPVNVSGMFEGCDMVPTTMDWIIE